MGATQGPGAGAPPPPDDLSYSYDVDGALTEVSDAFCRRLGWRREELLGRFAPSLAHPDERGRLIAQGEAFLAGTGDLDPVWRVRHASGDYRWYALESTLVRDGGDVVVGASARLRDVDQAQAARDALLDSERRYRLLVQNSHDVVAHSVRGVLRWISPSITSLAGWSPDELVGQSTLHLWHPDDQERARTLREGAVGGPPGAGVLRLARKDGSYVHVDVGVHGDGEPLEPGVVVTLRDATERVAAMETLRAREQEYRLIAENAGDMVALFGLDGRIQWVSPSIERLLGVTAGSMVGRTLVERMHADDVPTRDAAMDTIDSGEPTYLEGRFAHADGHHVWLGAHIRPVFDDLGHVIARLGTLREVTREVEARQQLEAREAEYRMLAENAADIVFRLDAQAHLSWLSPSVETVLGHRPEQLLGSDPDALLHPDDVDRRRRAIEASRDGRTAYEARYRHADGGYRWLAVTGRPMVDEEGVALGRIGTARVIDAEVAARQALEESERTYRLLAENSVDIVTQTDLDGVVQWVSPSVNAVLGWDAEALLGRNIGELIHPDDRGVRQRSREVALAGGAPQHLARYLHRDGHWVWLAARGAPLRDAAGDVVGAVGSARDATAEVEAREALQRSEEMFRLLAENSADIVVRSSLAGVIQWASPSIESTLGWTPDELVGTDFVDLLHPDDLGRRDAARAATAAGEAGSFLARYLHKDGRWVWLSVTIAPMLDDDGEIVGVVGSGRDATFEVHAREALQRSESRFRLLAENASDLVLQSGVDGTVEWVAPSVTRLLGWAPDEIVGRRFADLLHPDDLPARSAAPAALAAGQRVSYLSRYRHKDGRWVWLAVTGSPVVDDSGAQVGIVGSGRDVTAEVEGRQALEASEEMFRSVMDSSTIGMAVVGLDRGFRAVNPALRALTGHDEQWFAEHTAVELAPAEMWEGARRARMARFADGDRSLIDALRLLRADGTEISVRCAVILVRDAAGEPSHYVAQVQDISAELELEYTSFHDQLTGLRNRQWIVDNLDDELHAAKRSRSSVGVLFIDLDNFKVVNDSLGHSAGDELLAAVGQRLTAAVRPGDHVGRFGGDEFVVVVPDIGDISDLDRICGRVLEHITPPVDVQGHRITPSASIGVAVSAIDSSAHSLLRDADSALYRAKSAGKQRWHYADEAMHAQAVSRLTVEDELRRALAEHELVVHYQPIVRLTDRTIVGHEALVRWLHPDRGLVPPLEFLPVAEESGLIVDIGDEVLGLVCAKLVERPDLANVSVNLSPVQTSRAWWREKLVSQLLEAGVDPRRLSVEVTETAVLDNLDDVARELASLRTLGVGVHLDDFGTGYSSIALLRDLPITGLKLDMSFTRRLTGEGGTTEVLAGGLARLANGLGMLGIAEGVETEEQAALLLDMGWSHGQGWLFGRPAPEPA